MSMKEDFMIYLSKRRNHLWPTKDKEIMLLSKNLRNKFLSSVAKYNPLQDKI